MMKSGKIVLAVKDEYKLKHDRAVEVADNNLARAMENDDFRRITKELSSLNFDVVLKQARKQDASDELQKIKRHGRAFGQILRLFQKALLRNFMRFSRHRANPKCHVFRRGFFKNQGRETKKKVGVQL